jgi:hypothetical protein
MEEGEAGGARAERDWARRTRKKEGPRLMTSSADAGRERSAGVIPVAATTAGFTASFHIGQEEGRTEAWVAESPTVMPGNSMQ